MGVINLRLTACYISSPIFKTKNSKISQQLVKDDQELRKGVSMGSVYGCFQDTRVEGERGYCGKIVPGQVGVTLKLGVWHSPAL